MKKTEWFPCSVKPVRPGLYEVVLSSGFDHPELCSFNGGRWRKWNDCKAKAVGEARPGYMPDDYWRGVKK